METDSRPNDPEKEFLTLAYNRFYDMYAEVMTDGFWQREDMYRFWRISAGFAAYAEILHYAPMQEVLDAMKSLRPPSEAEIATDLFRFIRNVLFHFPFFDKWNEVWISAKLANWSKADQSIDRFLRKYAGRQEVKYRFWEEDKKKMTYMSICFPMEYTPEKRVYLKEVLDERDGSKFSFILMKSVLNTQVDEMHDDS